MKTCKYYKVTTTKKTGAVKLKKLNDQIELNS